MSWSNLTLSPNYYILSRCASTGHLQNLPLRPMKRTLRKRAFSIVELIVVIVVIGIIAAIAIPAISEIMKEKETETETVTPAPAPTPEKTAETPPTTPATTTP